MRDALSIFDQVVSFTGGHITYKSVIENLNVLDYEYYFKLTGFFLENKISDALLLLNDVLNKGFDGSHFITGLSSTCATCLSAKTRRHCRCLKWAQASANVTKHKHSNAPSLFFTVP